MGEETLVVNLFAGPGTGKSTSAAGLFYKMKSANINCEMALEYAKDKVWEGSAGMLSNQIYVFGKQQHRIHRLLGKVGVIITDSPLLLSIHYGEGQSDTFKSLVLEQHNSMNTFNVFLPRYKKYNPSGRLQTEEEARQKDVEIKEMLFKYGVPFFEPDGALGLPVVDEIFNKISDNGLIPSFSYI